jgi:hypothetical protein
MTRHFVARSKVVVVVVVVAVVLVVVVAALADSLRPVRS